MVPRMEHWLDGLWVPHCVACDAPYVRGLCVSCARTWRRRPLGVPIEGVEHAVGLVAYDSPTGDRLRRAKYGADRSAVRGLAEPFAARLEPWLRGAVDAVVPAPSPWTRRARRGFAAAAVLASVLARRLRVPLVHALELRPGAPNAALGAVGRRVNLRARLRSRSPVPGRVALVDDVATTGATAEACARELLGEATDRVIVTVMCATDRLQDDVPSDTP